MHPTSGLSFIGAEERDSRGIPGDPEPWIVKVRETACEWILNECYQHAKDSGSISPGTQRMEDHIFYCPVSFRVTSMPLKVSLKCQASLTWAAKLHPVLNMYDLIYWPKGGAFCLFPFNFILLDFLVIHPTFLRCLWALFCSPVPCCLSSFLPEIRPPTSLSKWCGSKIRNEK